MSLERKDVRFKLSAEMHAALTACAEADELDLGQWVERCVSRVVRERVHVATVLARSAERAGISGIRREDPSGWTPLDEGR